MVQGKKEVLIERVLTVWGVVVILWSFFRSNIDAALWTSEFIAKPLIFLVPIVVFVLRFEPEKGILGALGLQGRKPVRELLLAIGIFAVLMVLGATTLVKPRLEVLIDQIQWESIAALTGIALATAFSEEVMGRGFLFHYLFRYSRNMILSIFLSSILFFILFLPGILTTSLSGDILLMSLMLNLMISIITVLLYILRGNLYMSIAVHTAILLWFDILLSAGLH